MTLEENLVAKVIVVEFFAILDRYFHLCCCTKSPQKGQGVGVAGWGGQKVDYKINEDGN